MGKKRKSPKPTFRFAARDTAFASPPAAQSRRDSKAAGFCDQMRSVLGLQTVPNARVHRRLLALANFFNSAHQTAQMNGDKRPVRHAGVNLLTCDFKGVVANRAIERIRCNDVSQDELLDCIDAVLEFLELSVWALGHGGEFPAAAGASQRTASGIRAHRLSEIEE